MIISDTSLDELLKSFLQKKISFEIDKKVFKTGRVLLYSQKYFYISLVLNTEKKKQEIVDIPIPFNFENHKDDNLIYFDYRLTTLAHSNKEAVDILQKIPVNKNKFLNKILTIIIHNE